MGYDSGARAKCVVKRPAVTSAWGTAATGDHTNMVPMLSENLTNPLTMDALEAVEGQAGRSQSDKVAENPGGVVSCDLWYAGLEYFLYAAMGFECPTIYTGVYGSGSGGSPAPDHATPKAFHHIFELDDTLHRVAWAAGERAVSSGSAGDATYWTAADLKNRCIDACIDKGDGSSNFWRYVNAMVKSMTIRATLESCSIEFDLGPYKHEIAAISGTAALPANARDRCLFPHLAVGLSAVASTAPTALAVSEIAITLNNALDEVFESGGGIYKSEPMRSGPRVVTGSLKLARFRDATLPTALRAGTEQQLSMAFTGPSLITNIAGSAQSATMYPLLQVILPRVKLTKAEYPVAGPGVITGDVEFEALLPSAIPTAGNWIYTLAGGITLTKLTEMYLMLRNNRGWCWSRDNQTGAPGSPGALP